MIQFLLKLRDLLQRVHFSCCKTELDLAYLRKLSYYCQQIDEHIKSLHHMATYFEASSLLLTNNIFPTTKFLSILKQLLQCFMHIHERDTVRYIRQDLVLQHPHLGPSISCTWCCRRHNSACIYDWPILSLSILIF